MFYNSYIKYNKCNPLGNLIDDPREMLMTFPYQFKTNSKASLYSVAFSRAHKRWNKGQLTQEEDNCCLIVQG